jgi:hypothetical protein
MAGKDDSLLVHCVGGVVVMRLWPEPHLDAALSSDGHEPGAAMGRWACFDNGSHGVWEGQRVGGQPACA